MAPPPTKPQPQPKPAPIGAPVGLNNVNTLDSARVITRHLWREYHWKAPTTAYKGETDDDRRVAGDTDTGGAPIAKPTLNTNFHETAIATVEVDIPAGDDFYMRWWLEDASGAVIAEHRNFSKANFDAKDAKAKLAKAKYGWRWDGRFKNANGKRVFLRNQTCKSRVQVKSKTRADIPVGAAATAEIAVQGDPYKVFVVGLPKSNAELDAEMKGRGRDRWLHTDGARLATDCWIKVYRGVATEPGNENNLVFLGHGAIEATGYETRTAGGVVKNGAIATPHDRMYRAWIRHRRFSGGAEVSLCEIANVAPAVGQEWLITLDQPAGLPPANNPFSDTMTNQPFKDGVQGHRSFNQGGPFLVDNASTGCTTVFDVSGGTAAKPAADIGVLKTIRASYGTWEGQDPTTDSRKNKVWGPPLKDGRPGSFFNKQTKRAETKDAGLADTVAAPLLKPANTGAGATGFDEPLHMQPTFQHGLFGGFLGNEIAYTLKIPDEPDAATVVDPRMRIRCLLKSPPENSKAWQYHRLPVFGHTLSGTPAKATLELWVPRLIQRKWNGHMRNVLIGEWNGSRFSDVRCDYAWLFEQRDTGGVVTNRGYIGTKPRAGQDYTALDQIAYLKKSPAIPTFSAADIAHGDRLFSVFRYRIKLLPAPDPATSVWAPLTARTDLFSGSASPARLIDEEVKQVGSDWYLVGQSELEIIFPPPTA